MPKTHQNDILLVRNIDLDCPEVTQDMIPGSHRERDDDTGAEYTRYDNYPYEFQHKDYFAVRWASREHKIAPGETKLLPRFLAEHYAKHLANHILEKRERAEGRIGLQTNAIERPKVLNQIILKTVQRFEDDDEQDEGLLALRQAEELNKRPLDLGTGDLAAGLGRSRTMGDVDAGEAVNPAVGVLTTETPQTAEEALVAAGEQPQEAAPLPSRPELIAEAHQLGIHVEKTDTREILAAKIRNF